MIAILCDTPYQLVSGIFLANHISRDEKLLVFLNLLWGKSARQFDINSDNKRICKVLYYGKDQMGAGMLLRGLKNPLNMLSRMDGFDENFEISTIITTRTTWMATYLYNFFKMKNKDLKMYLTEEGCSEYASHMGETRFTRVCKLLFKKTHYDYIDAAYFSAPELYPYQVNFPIYKLPCSADDKDSVQLIDSMFETHNDLDKLAPYKYIFLDEGLNNDELRSKFGNCEEKILKRISKVVDKEDIVIKMHPRTNSYDDDQGIAAVYTKFPFEILPAHINMDNRVMISALSTAMLTSKFLYDQEPYLVFIYNLVMDVLHTIVPDKKILENAIHLMEGVRSIYREPNKVFAPKTLDELEQVFVQIRAELGSRS
ncbi:MAG: polysialyltransferase family glycosyltransferase [Eubacteriales bacterium]